MAFQSVPLCIQAEVRMRLDNQNIENVLHFETEVTPDLAMVQAVAEMVRDWVLDNYIGPLSGAVSFYQVTAKSLVNEFDWVYDLPVVPAVLGAGGATYMPNEVALCMSLRTGFSGRSQRGRAFVSGIPTTQVTGNLISETFASNMLNAWNELIIAAPAADVVWSVLSRETDGAPRPTGVLFPVTTVTLTDLYVDSQRRRKPGNGT